MNHSIIPSAHPDPWVDVLRGYLTKAVKSLAGSGLQVERSWLDPRHPRDATIIFSDPASDMSGDKLALVWDEVAGWRSGVFESGSQGVRTVLSATRHLGGGLLPDGAEIIGRIQTGAAEPRVEYRSMTSLHDGLDGALLDRS